MAFVSMPGGSEYSSIFRTVLRAKPNSRATARWLRPSAVSPTVRMSPNQKASINYFRVSRTLAILKLSFCQKQREGSESYC